MPEPDFKICLDETLTRAFSCKDPKARAAFLALADFYELQAQMQAVQESGGPLQVFR